MPTDASARAQGVAVPGSRCKPGLGTGLGMTEALDSLPLLRTWRMGWSPAVVTLAALSPPSTHRSSLYSPLTATLQAILYHPIFRAR